MSPAPTTNDLNALAQGGRTNVAGFFVRLIARIPFLFVAGRIYGAEELGRLAYAILVVEFAAQIATLGLKRGLALYLAQDDRHEAAGCWDAALLATFTALLLMTGLLIFPQAMFPNSIVDGVDRLLPLVIPAIAMTEIALAALAYRYNVKATVRARSIVEPWTISIASFAFSYVSLRDGLILSYAASMVAAFIAALIPFVQTYSLRHWKPNLALLPPLATRNLPLAVADAVEWGTRRIDLAILGLFVSPATVGIYYVAQQLSSLPQKLKSSFDPVLGPVITRNLEAGNRLAIADAINQVGFWIIAAQAGVALFLGIPGAGIMGLIGKHGVFVGGMGALAFQLLAEVIASTAVVSEAALVYVARHINMVISLVAMAIQAALSVLFILVMRNWGWPETWQAAGPAAAIAIALSISALLKAQLAAHELGTPVHPFRWALIGAALAAGSVGGIATMMPEWIELAIGAPIMLALYCGLIWRYGFGESDRALFRAGNALKRD